MEFDNILENESKTIDQCYLDMFADYDDVLYVKDVSKMLKTCEKRVRRMFRSGEIKSFLYGCYHCTAKLRVIEYMQESGRKIGQSIAQQRKEAIFAYCKDPRSRRQMQEHLDISDKKHFMDKVLHPLLEAGYIEMTISSNPNHIRQRYVVIK